MNTNTPATAFGKASGWSIIWGILMFICGLIAIALPLISSIGIVILLAWVILFAGLSHLVFAFHSHGVGSVLWQILLAVLYVVAGIYLLISTSRRGLVTLVLAFSFLRASSRSRHLGCRASGTQGALLDGIITLILGILIWRQWPSSSV